MSHTTIMRDASVAISDADRHAARQVMQQGLRGIDDKHQARWMRLLRDMFSLQDGEVVQVGGKPARNTEFHRRHMALEQAVFNAQQRFKEFEQFRNWLKIGAGHVTWVPGAKGGVVPLPKSISYVELNDDAMQRVHDAMLDFLGSSYVACYLWKELEAEQAVAKMAHLLEPARALCAACQQTANSAALKDAQ
jgi:hypothetical protein